MTEQFHLENSNFSRSLISKDTKRTLWKHRDEMMDEVIVKIDQSENEDE
jgi:hypothetical protein